MAILKHLQVRILDADGSEFAEYAPIHQKNSDRITCFVESTDGQKFDIEFKPQQDFPMELYSIPDDDYPDGIGPDLCPYEKYPWLWTVSVTFDGAPEPQYTRFFERNPANPEGKFVIFLRPTLFKPDSAPVSCQWLFSDVKNSPAGVMAALEDLSLEDPTAAAEPTLDDLDTALATTHIQQDPEEEVKQGSIRVDVTRELSLYQAFNPARSDGEFAEPTQGIAPDVTHLTRDLHPVSGEEIIQDDTPWIMYVLDKDGKQDKPFATFLFHYRSSEKLIQFGVKDAPKKRTAAVPNPVSRKRQASIPEDDDTGAQNAVENSLPHSSSARDNGPKSVKPPTTKRVRTVVDAFNEKLKAKKKKAKERQARKTADILPKIEDLVLDTKAVPTLSLRHRTLSVPWSDNPCADPNDFAIEAKKDNDDNLEHDTVAPISFNYNFTGSNIVTNDPTHADYPTPELNSNDLNELFDYPGTEGANDLFEDLFEDLFDDSGHFFDHNLLEGTEKKDGNE